MAVKSGLANTTIGVLGYARGKKLTLHKGIANTQISAKAFSSGTVEGPGTAQSFVLAGTILYNPIGEDL